MIRFLVFIILLTGSVSYSQELTKEIDKLYNFQPQKLSREEQNKIMPRLDAFWDKIKNDTAKFLPVLRKELMSIGHNPYFYYDCAKLLLMLSKTIDDQQIALNSIEKCDLKDISQADYVRTINWLAGSGLNVTKAAFKILDEKEYSAFLVQHSLTLSKDDCFLFCVLPMNHEMYYSDLLSVYPKLKYLNSKTAVLTALAYVSTCSADSVIKVIASDDKSISEFINKLQSSFEVDESKLESNEYLKEYVTLYSNKSVTELVKMRKESAGRVSDEAMYEIALITHYILKRRDCR